VAGCDMLPGTPGLTLPLAGDARPYCEKLCNLKWDQCMKKADFGRGVLYTVQPNDVKSAM
jgi:hypothetical protein